LPDPPEPLLLERRVLTGEDVDADRITADGRVWSYTTVDARLEGGEWSFRKVDIPAWREEARLTPQALGALREAIADSGFFDAPAEFHPDVTVIHGSSEEWTAELGGRRHTSILHGRGVTRAPVLEALAAALEAALASTDTG
jgi:hypothetical protein